MVHDGKRRVDGFKVRVVSHHLNDKGMMANIVTTLNAKL